MQRRDFITLLVGASAWPLAAEAQQRAMPVVGYISGRSREGDEAYTSALLEGLKRSGFVDGSTMLFDGRWTQGQYGQVPVLTVDLVGKGAAVIVVGGTAAALAVKGATATVPIVFIPADFSAHRRGRAAQQPSHRSCRSMYRNAPRYLLAFRERQRQPRTTPGGRTNSTVRRDLEINRR